MAIRLVVRVPVSLEYRMVTAVNSPITSIRATMISPTKRTRIEDIDGGETGEPIRVSLQVTGCIVD